MSNENLAIAVLFLVVVEGLWVAIFVTEISELRKKIRVLEKGLVLQNSKYRDSGEMRKRILSFNLSQGGRG